MRKAALTVFGVAIATLVPLVTPVFAQSNYPANTIRIIVGFPPGGATDIVARLLGQKLSAQMNVSTVVDNKPGANGNISAELVSQSKPDGYTLLFNTSSIVLSVALGEKVNYDILKDLTPIALVSSTPSVLVVNPSVPANSVGEFIAYVKKNPNKIAFSSAGVGNPTHLAALLFLQANGLTAIHIPYKGGGAGLTDLVGGRVQFSMQNPITALPMLKNNSVKVLAITSLKRSPLMPDVPTLNETVSPGFEMGAWFGVMAPPKMPPAIVQKLNAEIQKALHDPDMAPKLAQASADPLFSTPEQYGAYIKSELERWTKVVKSANIQPE